MTRNRRELPDRGGDGVLSGDGHCRGLEMRGSNGIGPRFPGMPAVARAIQVGDHLADCRREWNVSEKPEYLLLPRLIYLD